MKKIIIPSVLILLLSFSSKNVYSHNNFYLNQPMDINQQELYEGSLKSLLYPYILDEITKYYGQPKQFEDMEILNIKKTPDKFEYEITIQVITFTGPHNPPRGRETVTILTNSMGTKVINFKHEPE
ncbi:DUF3888 domain-containing protein [uncultured Clostridium sp.]|uniref:DUF3888 domain-containing protein n=1 Tax=uncultured Clostridium sp. TaxID=59620 RepID=UPI0028E67FFE|nr:DUF3888 domain-containing protein [uncultured Clostridium sp.]